MLKPQIEKIQAKLTKKATNAESERGVGMLRSLRIVTNVLYALMIFEMFKLLPFPEDPDFHYTRLSDVIADNQSKIIILGIGLGMIIIYWVQGNVQFGNLTRSSKEHAILAMAQMASLMLYIYFVIFEIGLKNSVLALQMQSACLGIAGILGVINWRYARFKKFTTDQIDDKEEMDLFYKMLPEPFTALFTIFFAAYGAQYWSLSWLFVFPITYGISFLRRKYTSAHLS